MHPYLHHTRGLTSSMCIKLSKFMKIIALKVENNLPNAYDLRCYVHISNLPNMCTYIALFTVPVTVYMYIL